MLIASCTSYPKRVSNLPVVVDSILRNTCKPDKIIINLSIDEFSNRQLPKDVDEYVKAHKEVFVNWLEGNWKVYKKFLPIVKDYPNDLILSFDDDTIYPEGIIADLMSVHKKYPNAPVASNHYWMYGLKCHCGECSLTQPKHFEGWEQYVNDEMITKCPADDLFYTNLAAVNGYFYKWTETNYPTIWEKYNEINGYSASIPGINKNTEKELFNVLGRHVKMMFTDDLNKPICVLNAVANLRGLRIETEMLKWVYPQYNVFVVEHDGTKFEYYGLKFLQNYVAHNDVKVPILYLHTKGAVKVRTCSQKVHNLWKFEFGRNMGKCLDILNTAKPTIVTPYAGYAQGPYPAEGKEYPVPWYNGWIANPAALKLIDVPLSENRYVYETCLYKGIEVVGTRMNGISWTADNMKPKDDDLNANF